MRIAISVAGEAWGGKQSWMLRLAADLEAAGHSVTVVAEQGSAVATRAVSACVAHLAISFDDPPAATALAAPLATADVVVTSGRHDSMAVHRLLHQAGWTGVRVMFRHSPFPLEDSDDVRAMVSGLDAVVLTSRSQLRDQFGAFLARGVVAEEQLVVVPSAIDTDRFAPRRPSRAIRDRLGIPAGAAVVGCVARLSWEKGHEVLLRAMAELSRPATSEPVLVLAGEGEERGRLEQLAVELGLAASMRFTGFCDDVAELLSVCTTLVLPSVAGETGPLALKEAMAMGVPVIASAVGGIPEFVIDGETGVLVPPGDVAALAHGIATLLGDRTLRERLGRSGRAAILAGHVVRRRSEGLVRLIDLLCLRRLRPQRVLKDLAWNPNARLRKEPFGGLVFVPETSMLVEMEPDAFRCAVRSWQAGEPTLLEAAGERLTPLLEDLWRSGALRRTRPVPARPGRG